MHCPVDTCAKICVMFCTEEYIAESKVIKIVSDAVRIFMALPPTHFIVLIKQNKNKMYAQSLKMKIKEKGMQLNKTPQNFFGRSGKIP